MPLQAGPFPAETLHDPKVQKAAAASATSPKPPAKATKQSGVGDVRPFTHLLLWLAPSLLPYVTMTPAKSKEKSIILDQGLSTRQRGR